MEKFVVFSHAVNPDVSSRWGVKDLSLCAISRTIVRNHIIHFEILAQYTSFFWWLYHVIVIDGEWIYGTCQVEEVCNFLILV